MATAKILWADDEIPFMEGIFNSLAAEGLELDPALTVAETLQKLRSGDPAYDLLMLDLMLPLGSDIEKVVGRPIMENLAPEDYGMIVLEEIADNWPSLPVIVFTAIRSDIRGLKAPRNLEVLKKPVTPGDLFEKIFELIKRKGGSDS